MAFDTRKATALLAHLALADRPRSREALCELLWPDQDPEHARGALRRTLSTLRKSVGEQWVDTAGDSVALRDGDCRSTCAGSGRWRRRRRRPRGRRRGVPRRAARGVLRARQPGASTRGTCTRRTRSSASSGAALGRLVRALAERGEYGRAIRHAQRWLALDPLHEPAHRELIRLYALDGDRAAALAQYRDCVRTLSQELGVPPVDETAALFEQVSEGTLVAARRSRRPLRRSRARRRSCRSSGRAGGARRAVRRARRRPAGRRARGDRGRGRDRQVAARARADHDRGAGCAVGALPRGRGGSALRADRRAARRGARGPGRSPPRAAAAAGRRLAARARARDARPAGADGDVRAGRAGAAARSGREPCSASPT